MWDEEYIAQGFENIGCEVLRIKERAVFSQVPPMIREFEPDFVLFAKFDVGNPDWILNELKKSRIKTVCWVFDLYWGYAREYQIKSAPMFKADVVITTDGGNSERWKEAGINHFTVRQGIRSEECFMCDKEKKYDIVFVGSANPHNDRQSSLSRLKDDYGDNFHWFGRADTNEIRGTKLNELYGETKVVVGDSVFSPYYWSNRVVETLGRGGFLIHQDTPGLKEKYPHIVTYKRRDYDDLKEKIDYYLSNDKERNDIIKKNFEWVKDNYTCEKQCQKVLDICLQ